MAVASGQSKTATGTASIAPTPTPTFVPPTPSTSPTATASFVPGTVSYAASMYGRWFAVKADSSAIYIPYSYSVVCLGPGCPSSSSYSSFYIDPPTPSSSLTPSATQASSTPTMSGSATITRTSTITGSPTATLSRNVSPSRTTSPWSAFSTSATSTSSSSGSAAVPPIGYDSSGSVSITGIALDSSGNLIILDLGFNRLLKYNVSAASYVTMRTGVLSSGGYCNTACCYGIAVEMATSNVYIADSGASCIKMWSNSGQTLTTVAGSCGSSGYNMNNGVATSIQLNTPGAVSLDSSGNIYIGDTYNNCVRKLTKSSGQISSVVGVCGSYGSFSGGGAGTATLLSAIAGVAVDLTGNVYVGTYSSSRYIIKWAVSTGIVAVVPGSGAEYGSASSSSPGAISLDINNNIYFQSGSNINVLFVAISSSPSAQPTRSSSPSPSVTPSATVTPYCAPSLYRVLPRMDLVGTLVGSAMAPNAGFYTDSEAACRQACCDAAVCDSYAYAGGAAGYYVINNYNYGFGAQCFLYVNVTALAPSSIVSSGALISKYS